MKVGTDGVLLGAWASVTHQPQRILDIGSGTGLLALQLAQRCQVATIDAIEIDEKAFTQCAANFKNSPWSSRLKGHLMDWNAFYDRPLRRYDLIVSNPPFFETPRSGGATSLARQQARFTNTLSNAVLLEGVAKCLSEAGCFCVVLPYDNEASFRDLAQEQKLNLSRILRTRGTDRSPLKRSFMEFRFGEVQLKESELVIELARHQYSSQYRELTRDFYLKM